MSAIAEDSGVPKGVEKYNSVGRELALKIDAAARKIGGSWMHFSQSIWLNGQMLGQEGVCASMVAIFLGRTKAGEKGMISYFDSSAGREEVSDLWTMQKSNVHGWEDLYLASRGLTRRYARRGDTPMEIAELIKINGYYTIGISDMSGTYPSTKEYLVAAKSVNGHALAVVIDSANSSYLLFDPNWGIGLFPDAAKLAKFLLALWSFEYSDLVGQTLLSRHS